jgi:hypothetical protein
MTGRWQTLGDALGQGLASGVNNYISTTNTYDQQRQAQANVALDQQYRQQQADEQRRQFEAQQRQSRDTQTFQWLNGQQQQLTGILAKGGFAKESAEYKAAEAALKETNRLMGKVVKGGDLTPEEQQGYDTLLGNVGAITAQGAATIGGRVTASEDAGLAATTTQTTAVGDANRRANDLQPGNLTAQGLQNEAQGLQNTEFAVTSPYRQNVARVQSEYAEPNAAAGLNLATAQGRTATAQANVAEGTQDATIARAGLENDALGVQLDTARWQLGDLQTKAPLVYEGLRLSNAGAQQALDFNSEMQPERMTALRQTNEQTRQTIDQSAELFPWQKRALTAQVNVQEAQADIVQATKTGTISRQNAESYAAIAQNVRDPAAFDQLVKDGVLTEAQAAPFKALAGYYRDAGQAELDRARAGVTLAQSQGRVATATEGAQISAAQSGARQAGSDADLAASNVRVATGTETSRINTAASGATQSAAEAAVAAGTVGPRISAAQSGATSAAADAQVAAGTVGARIDGAQAGARGAAAQATSAEAAAAVDVATIPAMIAARQLAPQTAQAALNAQLIENRFADASFAGKLRALDLGNATSTQQLLAMKQQYSQNAAKFPQELKYLNAQISLMKANAQEAASKVLAADGNGVTDKKTMVTALTQMRIINSQDVRTAQAGLRSLTQRYLPNAKFSVDKYDSKSFTTLIASATNLSQEQQAELQAAQQNLDAAQQTSTDLSQAFGQVSAKGRVDPKIAERLGIFSPDEASNSDSPYGDTKVGNVSLVTRFPGTAPIPRSFNQDARFEISRTAGRLGIDANALAAIISFETSGTFNPNARNGGSSATGLIQFMAGKGGTPGKYYGMTRDEFGKLSFAQQMPYVERYLREAGIGPGSTMADVYAAVTGSGYKRGSAAYEKNRVWDANKDGVIDRGEQVLSPAFQSHVRDYFGTQGKAGPAAPTGTAPAAQQPASTQAKPTDVAGTLQARSSQLVPFYATVKKAPSAAAATKLLQDQATALAGGPNAPQALKAQYFDALLAAARQ